MNILKLSSAVHKKRNDIGLNVWFVTHSYPISEVAGSDLLHDLSGIVNICLPIPIYLGLCFLPFYLLIYLLAILTNKLLMSMKEIVRCNTNESILSDADA